MLSLVLKFWVGFLEAFNLHLCLILTGSSLAKYFQLQAPAIRAKRRYRSVLGPPSIHSQYLAPSMRFHRSQPSKYNLKAILHNAHSVGILVGLQKKLL